MSQGLQSLLQVRHALGGPFDQTHRVPFGVEQSLQIGDQGFILALFLFPACALLSLPSPRRIAIFPLNLFESTTNRILGDSCIPSHFQKTSPFLRFERQKLSPLFLVDDGSHLLVFAFSLN